MYTNRVKTICVLYKSNTAENCIEARNIWSWTTLILFLSLISFPLLNNVLVTLYLPICKTLLFWREHKAKCSTWVAFMAPNKNNGQWNYDKDNFYWTKKRKKILNSERNTVKGNNSIIRKKIKDHLHDNGIFKMFFFLFMTFETIMGV